ncbi:MAG TPA: hypothetical protein VK752_08475 [Bryobacteraceae bacterium]|nr:hypothetical protein [Bryobacteraceae bacterium]
MPHRLAALAFMTTAFVRASSIQYTISNDVYNSCGGPYCTGGPYSLTVTFDVPSGTNLDNLTFTQGPLDTGTGGNIEPYITSFILADGTGLQVTNSNVTGNDWFNIATDGSGNITAWYINVSNSSEYAWTYWFPSYPQVYYTSGNSAGSGSCFQYGQSSLPATSCGGNASMEPTGGASAPEPATWALWGLGSFLFLLRQYVTNKRPGH